MAAKTTFGTGSVAYSYIRFSDPSQAEGDSLRRQADGAKAWCDRNGVRLDTTTTLRDLGKSAFTKSKRKDSDAAAARFVELSEIVNPDRRALTAFCELIRGGKILRHSFLIIENLDRLSRDEIVPAVNLLTSILLAGVRVVQLKPAELVYTEKSDMMALMQAVMELSRGNSESKVKSQRVGDAWANRRKYVRERKVEIMHRNLPAWVEERDGKLYAVPEKALVIQKIYALAAQGMGANRITKRLITENVPPFLDVVKGKGVKGERAGKWKRSYVAFLLADRRVVGELQPKSKGRKDGEPMKDYFPAVISEGDWQRARAGSKVRRKAGERGKGTYDKPDFVNVFAGLLWDGRDGSPYHSCLRYEGIKPGARGRPHYVLRNQASVDGRAVCQSFPFATFERAVVACLKNLDPKEVTGDGAEPDESLTLAAELEGVAAQVNKIKDNLLSGGDVSALADVLRQLAAKQLDLTQRLQAARERAVLPLDEAVKEVKRLAKRTFDPNDESSETPKLLSAMDAAKDKQDFRLRLRAVLRRIVDSIHMVVTNRGRTRLCGLQIWFNGAKRFRHIRILHRPPTANMNGKLPGRWIVVPMQTTQPAERCTLDLRKPEDAEREMEALRSWPFDRELEGGLPSWFTGVISPNGSE